VARGGSAPSPGDTCSSALDLVAEIFDGFANLATAFSERFLNLTGRFVGLAFVAPLGAVYLVGVAIVAALLVYEQSLVRADDLSQVKRAFDLNGYVGILYLLVLAASLYAR